MPGGGSSTLVMKPLVIASTSLMIHSNCSDAVLYCANVCPKGLNADFGEGGQTFHLKADSESVDGGQHSGEGGQRLPSTTSWVHAS
jgi:hypothetical protein